MPNEPYDSPQKPHGGDEDYVWSPDGTKIIYVCKKKAGTAYATSTNTDLYEYDVATKNYKKSYGEKFRLRYTSRFFTSRRFNLVANETRWF